MTTLSKSGLFIGYDADRLPAAAYYGCAVNTGFFRIAANASLAGHIQKLRFLEPAGAAAAVEKIDNYEEIRL